MSVKGKRLLVLGGGTATLDLVKNAKEMGVYTIVTDYLEGGVAKDIADETAMVSTIDLDALAALIKERNVDGVFCGPSEFNIRNLIKLCERTGLPCYTDMTVWDRCANKDEFKQYCIDNGVDCPRKFEVDENSTDEELAAVDYPVIVKPVDGSSSNGISVSYDKSTIREACRFAMEYSKCKRIVVEKYIENGGELFGARYLIRDGVATPYLLMDTYIADHKDPKGLISHFTYTPSKYADYYMSNMDAKVRQMLSNMGLKNGTAFFQALPYKGKIYFHEMGYRLSGGMLFKLTTPLMGINDMKMMIRTALGEPMFEDGELEGINILSPKRFGAQLTVPLRVGTIASIEGLEGLKNMPCVVDFIQYYHEGDTLLPKNMGTLGQHFGRFTMVADSPEELKNAVARINGELVIKDTEGARMNGLKFDLERTE
ncbi:MAG: hypothetical protein IJB76_00040 [Clostridia bacterium]|nr:hypothetical protein [Clostridia bacterium]MBQ4647535.1 hypothetical protein [Clostridia bacterium]